MGERGKALYGRPILCLDAMFWAASADWMACRTQVHTLRVEVQRLQVKIQEAEARASASQRIAEEAQRELQAVLAASNSPVAGQARQAIDAEKAILRQQLMVSNITSYIQDPLSPHPMHHTQPRGVATLPARKLAFPLSRLPARAFPEWAPARP